MQVSAEIRWFWKTSAPAGLEEWFKSQEHHPCRPGGGAIPRTDLYRRAKQADLAIKLRGNKGYEVKGLVEVLAPLAEPPFTGAAELWTKWGTDGLRFDVQDMIATTKLRWIRKLDTTGPQPREIALGPDERPINPADFPNAGCQVELTQIFAGKDTWWSFSFESFGAVATVERDLRATVAAMAKRRPPPLSGGLLASYPAWLREHDVEG